MPKQNQSLPQALPDDAQKTLAEEMGLGGLSQDKQEELLVRMTEVLLKRIFLETLEKLSEDDQEAYSKMIDAGAEPQEIENFLKEKISNYDEMVKKIVDDFKEEMKKDLAKQQ